MPEARLERTRNPRPTVPACVRLGHELRCDHMYGMSVCIRCGLSVDRHGRGGALPYKFKESKTR